MNKEEFIKRRGEVAYEKMLQRNRDWNAEHPKNRKVIQKKWAAQHRDKINGKSGVWRAANPDKVKVHNQEMSRKGGKYYAKKLEYRRVGIPGERNKIRDKHKLQYRAIKEATPNSVLHHEWIPGTVNYRGVALVEKEAHQHGIIKVIKVLEGHVTLFTEKEIKEQEVKT